MFAILVFSKNKQSSKGTIVYLCYNSRTSAVIFYCHLGRGEGVMAVVYLRKFVSLRDGIMLLVPFR